MAKTIVNETTGVKADDRSLTRFELLKMVAEIPNPKFEVLDIKAMRKRDRIITAIEKSDQFTLVLEDADFDYLVSLYRAFPFLLSHRDILKLDDHLQSLKTDV